MSARRAAALAAAILLVAAPAVRAAPESFTLDPSHTIPTFAVSHLGLSLQRGMFTRAAGTVTITSLDAGPTPLAPTPRTLVK